jgi:hypothetical protein
MAWLPPAFLLLQTVLFTNKQGASDAPEKRAVMEAAVSSSVVHPNVVSTYHYDIRAVQTVAKEGALQIEDEGQATDWKLYLVQVGQAACWGFHEAFGSCQAWLGLVGGICLFEGPMLPSFCDDVR